MSIKRKDNNFPQPSDTHRCSGASASYPRTDPRRSKAGNEGRRPIPDSGQAEAATRPGIAIFAPPRSPPDTTGSSRRSNPTPTSWDFPTRRNLPRNVSPMISNIATLVVRMKLNVSLSDDANCKEKKKRTQCEHSDTPGGKFRNSSRN